MYACMCVSGSLLMLRYQLVRVSVIKLFNIKSNWIHIASK